ncbi:MAG: HEAT repeat domain-containing protein [Candidatus Eisenbacteria bacterium]
MTPVRFDPGCRLARILPVLPAAVSLLLPSVGADCLACSCLPSPRTLVAVAESDAVFTGLVIERFTPAPGSPTDTPAKRAMRSSCDCAYRIVVDQVWKGVLPDTVVVETACDGAACGYAFGLEEMHLVYARTIEGITTTGLCTRSSALEDGVEDLVELALLPPDPTPSVVDSFIVDHLLHLFPSESGQDLRDTAWLLGSRPEYSDVSVPLLVAAFPRAGGEDRRALVRALRRLAVDAGIARGVLADALRDDDPWLRVEAISAILHSRLGDAEVLADARELLADDSPDVRAGALHALVESGRPICDLASDLVAATADTDANVRAEALRALCRCSPDVPGLVPIILAGLEDPSSEVRFVSAYAAGKFSSPDVADRLIPALTMAAWDEDVSVRAKSIGALGAFLPDDRALDALMEQVDPGLDSPSRTALGVLTDPDRLSGLASGSEPGGSNGPGNSDSTLWPAARRALRMAMDSEDGSLRAEAAKCAGSLADLDETVHPIVLAALADSDWRVRRSAVWAVANAEMFAPRAESLLQPLAADSMEPVRVAVQNALRRVAAGPPAPGPEDSSGRD